MLKKNAPPVLRHLLSMHSLNATSLTYLLDRAEYFLKTAVKNQAVIDTLKGKVIANIFFEPSTRTRNSFEIAEHRLGAIVLSPDMQQSSTRKGELLIDTVRNLEAMGVALLVVRHHDSHFAQFLETESHCRMAIINAGDGYNEHPTQALLDLLTIRQHFPGVSSLTVAIVGDVVHSRVARSLVLGLRLMGVNNIHIIAPKAFAPSHEDFGSTKIFHHIDEGLKDVDVVYTLRIQKERMEASEHPVDEKYFKEFGLTQTRLALAKKHAIVMHPGPMNRGIEIESSVADGAQSVILQQTQNSVAVRMAVIETVVGGQ